MLARRAKLRTDTRVQATGPCDRPAYEDPCHITWLMTLHEYRYSATASAGADAHSQSPASVKKMNDFAVRVFPSSSSNEIRRSGAVIHYAPEPPIDYTVKEKPKAKGT
ncbi:unnamed protein product [Heligmosomoides polygyrus]|uniref:Uncharacterized protein n=1 Tax=Heligmosomoides polygyrus TaxID=6339 RepID=A0A183GDN7_HELPZ|nr:unnamed protein product [Heligmosomoides polygyrus]